MAYSYDPVGNRLSETRSGTKDTYTYAATSNRLNSITRASGNRSSVVWALAHAGKRPVDELVGLPARFGYQLDHLRPQIEALAGKTG